MTYYLLRGSERLGPYTEEQVRGMLARGEAGPDMLAWHEGRADWAPLGALLGQPFPAPAAPGPGAPPPASKGVQILKGCLMAFGAFSAVMVVLGGIVFGIAAYLGAGFDRTSKAYVDDAVPAIVAAWSSDELLRRVDPEYLHLFKKDAVDSLFQKFARLGAFERYAGSKGEASMNFDSGSFRITAKYECEVVFKNGHATVLMTLLRADGGWKVVGFHIESPDLL